MAERSGGSPKGKQCPHAAAENHGDSQLRAAERAGGAGGQGADGEERGGGPQKELPVAAAAVRGGEVQPQAKAPADLKTSQRDSGQKRKVDSGT